MHAIRRQRDIWPSGAAVSNEALAHVAALYRTVGFGAEAYVEKARWEDVGGAEIMARLLAVATASTETVKAVAEMVGWSEEAGDKFVVKRQPRHEAQQKGKFGEVLHAAILETFHHMVVVTKRHMYNPAPGAPVHGIDLVALGKIEGMQGERVVYAETKLRTAQDRNALIRARADLARVNREDVPVSIAVEAERLRKSDPALFKRLVNAALERNKAQYRIGAVFEESQWSDSLLSSLDRVHDPDDLDMVVDIVKIGSLHDLVLESYKKVGRVV